MRTTDKMENCILILYYYIIFTYLIDVCILLLLHCMSTLLPHSIGMVEKTEYGVTEYGVTEYGVTEYGVTEYGVTEYGVTEYGVTEYGVTKYGVTESRSTESRSTESRSTESRSTEYGVKTEYGVRSLSVKCSPRRGGDF